MFLGIIVLFTTVSKNIEMMHVGGQNKLIHKRNSPIHGERQIVVSRNKFDGPGVTLRKLFIVTSLGQSPKAFGKSTNCVARHGIDPAQCSRFDFTPAIE